jgi:two-component system phosphate regulon sensor histidine kinase PhoR
MPDPQRNLGRRPEGVHARQSQRLALLVQTARRFSASLDQVTVIQTVVRHASEALDGLAVLSLLEQDGALRVAALYHPDHAVAAESEAIFRGTPPRTGRGILGSVAQSGAAMLVFASDPLTPEQRIYFERSGHRASLSVPLRGRQGIVGVLSVSQVRDSTGPPLTAEDLDLAQALADQAALAIENARLYGASEQARAFYQAAVQGAAAGIVIFDRDYRVLETNDSLLQIAGRARSELIGRHMPEVFPRLLAPGRPTRAALDRVLAGEIIRLREAPFDGPSGRTYWDIDCSPIRLAEHEILAGLVAIRDVSARVRDQQQLGSLAREAAARSTELRAIIDAMEEGVFVCDAEGTLILVNAAAARITGQTIAQAMQSPANVQEAQAIRFADRHDGSPREFPLARALRGESGVDSELLLRRPGTGEDLQVRVAFSPIRGGDDAIAGAVAVVSDITEIRGLERQRDEFLSLASHELRTPVASIKGYAQVLLRAQQRGGLDAERLTRMLRTIDRETDRLTLLVGDLLDISRIETGRLSLRFARLDLAALVDGVLERFSARLEGNHVLMRDLPQEPVWVQGDAERLEQILDNLLGNAVKYSPAGGALHVQVRGGAGGACVSVQDEGIGFPAGATDEIFQPYGRATNASTRNFAGLGLGLFISRSLAEQHGGTLIAESPGEDRGATFTLRLPLA